MLRTLLRLQKRFLRSAWSKAEIAFDAEGRPTKAAGDLLVSAA